MPSKDFGIYADATGGTVIDTTGPDAAYSATVQQGLAFSLEEVGRAEVTCNDFDRNVLVVHSTRGKLAAGATGTRTWRALVYVDDGLGGGFVATKQTYAMGFLSDTEGITQSDICAVSVVNLQQGHKLKVRQFLETTNGTGNFEEMANTALQLLALPRSFPVCIVSRSTQHVLPTMWQTLPFNEANKVDEWAFTFDATTGIVTVRVPGTLTVMSNVCCRSHKASGNCSGAVVQTRLSKTSVIQGSSLRSGHCPAVAIAQSYCSMNMVKRIPVVAGDTIKLEIQIETRVNAIEDFRVQQSRASMSMFLEYGVSADEIHLDNSTDQACDTTIEPDFDTIVAMDTPPFLHSVTENQHQVQLQTGKKYLIGCSLGMHRDAPTTTALAFEALWKSGALFLYRGASGCFNRGKIGANDQDESSIQMLLLHETVATTVFGVQLSKLGSGSDASVELPGSVTQASASPELFGIDLGDWPADRADGCAFMLGEAGHGKLDATVGQLATAAMGTLGESSGTAIASARAGGEARGLGEPYATAEARHSYGGEVHALGESGTTGTATRAARGVLTGLGETGSTGTAMRVARGLVAAVGEAGSSQCAAGGMCGLTIRSVTESVGDFRVYYPVDIEGNAVDDSAASTPMANTVGLAGVAVGVGEALARATAGVARGGNVRGLSEGGVGGARGGFRIAGQAIGLGEALAAAGGRNLVYAVTVAVAEGGAAAGALLSLGSVGMSLGEAGNTANTGALVQGVQAVAIGGGVALGAGAGGIVQQIEAREISEALAGGLAGVSFGVVATGIGEVLVAVAEPGVSIGATALGHSEGLAALADAAMRLGVSAVALGEGLCDRLVVGVPSATELVTFDARINRIETINLETARSVSFDAEIEAATETGLEA